MGLKGSRIWYFQLEIQDLPPFNPLTEMLDVSHRWGCWGVSLYDDIIVNGTRRSYFFVLISVARITCVLALSTTKNNILRTFCASADGRLEHQCTLGQSSHSYTQEDEKRRDLPDSITESLNCVSCRAGRNFIDVMKCCLWESQYY